MVNPIPDQITRTTVEPAAPSQSFHTRLGGFEQGECKMPRQARGTSMKHYKMFCFSVTSLLFLPFHQSLPIVVAFRAADTVLKAIPDDSVSCAVSVYQVTMPLAKSFSSRHRSGRMPVIVDCLFNRLKNVHDIDGKLSAAKFKPIGCDQGRPKQKRFWFKVDFRGLATKFVQQNNDLLHFGNY
ncbi:hypothetical protein AVEN_109434-1 [Araneus ventricosus]|uniref:Uncharacterized protein n=1 Tax=Araneus ventricosus TaxID=182803 RepID=A0A4Y2MSZ9_ARAVE|nr:hypothetical protein AVEN_109434-1 [Araneus ventricosus]